MKKQGTSYDTKRECRGKYCDAPVYNTTGEDYRYCTECRERMTEKASIQLFEG